MVFASRGAKYIFWAAIVLILFGLAIGYYVSSLTPERKPMEGQEKPYDYYIIIEEAGDKPLAFVSTVVVSVGDEYLTGDGQWYKVVRVEENRAYARRFEKTAK
ncbi:stage II sporulation protein P [Anaeroselena agilis]|uniref:Stage II sporulation protein P n=1 Tax=Anaeroselena agilis TaxID=3063788 RepID=A0ABU3NYS2_9FIRM|nr:stage II sporulation protein P [Selenomonadales bacterium 4137-cl]